MSFFKMVMSGSSFIVIPLVGLIVSTTVHAGELVAFQQPSPISIETTISESEVRVAEPIEVVITVTAAMGVHVNFPESRQVIGPFDVLDVEDRFGIPMGDHRQWIRRYQLDCILTGEQIIPSIEIGYVDRRTNAPVVGFVKTAAQTVNVVSSLEGTEDPTQFRDIKSVVFLPEPENPDYGWLVWAATGGLGILGLVAFVLAIRRQPRRTPRFLALRSLDELSKSEELSRGNTEFVYVTLTDILRHFIHAELKISAPTLTTGEFLNELKHHSQLSDSMRAELEKFLNAADMVKFARLAPGSDVLAQSIEIARNFVSNTETSRPPEIPISRNDSHDPTDSHREVQ